MELSASYKATYMLVICISVMCEGSIAAIVPTITLQKFGLIRGHDAYSIMYSAFGVSALIGSIFVKLLQAHIGFRGLVFIGTGLAVVALILTNKLNETKTFDYLKLYKKMKGD